MCSNKIHCNWVLEKSLHRMVGLEQRQGKQYLSIFGDPSGTISPFHRSSANKALINGNCACAINTNFHTLEHIQNSTGESSRQDIAVLTLTINPKLENKSVKKNSAVSRELRWERVVTICRCRGCYLSTGSVVRNDSFRCGGDTVYYLCNTHRSTDNDILSSTNVK